jgi:trimeric autotransporter adhesin
VYIVAGGVIRKVSNGVITTFAGVYGTTGYAGDNGPATSATFDYPASVAVDASGNVYIADMDNNAIRKVSKGVITTFAGNGTKGYSGDNGPPAAAELNHPNGVAVDALGNVYIADSGNARIRKVSNGAIATIAGGASVSFGDNGPATGGVIPAGWRGRGRIRQCVHRGCL